MNNKTYKLGEIWRFAVGQPDNKTYYFTGPVLEVNPDDVVIMDRVLNAKVKIEIARLIFSHQLPASGVPAANPVG